MVDISGMPQPPPVTPDPRECRDFAQWLKLLTDKKRYGVTQRMIAEVTNSTPQSVTKWLKGGAIEVERLVRLAAWVGYPYQNLQRLVDEAKLRTLPAGTYPAADPPGPHIVMEGEIERAWTALSPINRKQLLEVARVLKENEAKPRRRKK